jgi:hypothetical protein
MDRACDAGRRLRRDAGHPLEHSLFIRMVAVFAIVGTGLLYFIGDGEHAIGPSRSPQPVIFARDRRFKPFPVAPAP